MFGELINFEAGWHFDGCVCVVCLAMAEMGKTCVIRVYFLKNPFKISKGKYIFFQSLNSQLSENLYSCTLILKRFFSK